MSENMRVGRAITIVGIVNVALAVLGLCQLAVNVVGYAGIPDSFIDEYGPFMRGRIEIMSIMSAFLLVLLGTAGLLLLRRARYAARFSTVVFVVEIVAITIFCVRWTFGLSFLSLPVIAVGLMNGAVALQIVTLYPIVGLILLNLRHKNQHVGAVPA